MDVLPDSRPERAANHHFYRGMWWVPFYCANCGADGGMVPEENCTFAFWLCVPCGEKWAPLPGTFMTPDETFWKRVHEAQIENCGRELSAPELIEALKDENHFLTKLAKDR